MTELKLSTAAGDATGSAEKVVTKEIPDNAKAPVVVDLPQADGNSAPVEVVEKPIATV